MSKRGHQRPKPGQAVCAEPGCGAPLWWVGTGERPKKCGEHARNPPRYKPGTKLVPVPEVARNKRAVEQRARRRTKEAVKGAAVDELKVLRLALGLSQIPDDPERAARMVGLGDLSEETLAEVAELARGDRYRGLREGRPSDVASLYSTFLGLNAVHLLEEVSTLSPGSRAMSGRMAQQIVEALGGSKMIFPVVTVNLGTKRED